MSVVTASADNMITGTKRKSWKVGENIRCSAYNRSPDMSGACYEASVSYYKGRGADIEQWHVSALAFSMEEAEEKANKLASKFTKFINDQTNI